MSTKQVIIFPRGQLTRQDKERLTKAGIVSVEADNPGAVVQVIPGAAMVGADDFLMSALHALTNAPSSYSSDRFVKELHRRMLARETAATPAAGHQAGGEQP